MSSQLVDINSDGHMDILAGSFSGTPQIIMGHKEGYAAATDLLDKNDEEILIAAFGTQKKTNGTKQIALNRKDIARHRILSTGTATVTSISFSATITVVDSTCK